uniref:Gustatory receptor for sugar taste 64b-like n=1 Tax=Diabrotica virgifera virgifera TaxID=50390 RepID=A0A6P7FTD9_DIAVI
MVMAVHPKPIKTDDLHSNTKYVIRVAQVFGMFPLCNILDTQNTSISFKWLCPWTIYAIFTITATSIFCIASFVRMCMNDFKLHLLDSFVFCLNTNFIIIAFFKLSMCWPKLLRHFCKTENSIRKYGYYINCHKRFIIILTVAVGTVMC